jgi:hypothetical protein
MMLSTDAMMLSTGAHTGLRRLVGVRRYSRVRGGWVYVSSTGNYVSQVHGEHFAYDPTILDQVRVLEARFREDQRRLREDYAASLQTLIDQATPLPTATEAARAAGYETHD